MPTTITAYAPASVSNVACGFDIMGFALEKPGDRVTLRCSAAPGVRITAVTGDNGMLPLDPALNTAGAPVLAMLQELGIAHGVEMEIHKGLPIGSGIGSSAASAVAAAVACDALLGARLPKEDLLRFAIEGERIASGAVHVDNLAPCLWGGFVLVRGYHPIDLVRLRVPDGLCCAVVCPAIQIKTKEARAVLPAMLPLRDVVAQTGNAAGLVAGLLTADLELIARSLHDVIAEPARAPLIPGFPVIKAAALEAGALGCSISGSGPAVFALCASPAIATAAAEGMMAALQERHIAATSVISSLQHTGARVE